VSGVTSEAAIMSVTQTVAAGLIAVATLFTVPAASASVPHGQVRLPVDTAAEPDHWYAGGGWDPGGWNANRQPFLEPGEVRRILRDHGFRDIRNLDRRGAVYQAHAVDGSHDQVGLVVSARSGAILARYPIR
jgi:hypothetical protein